MDNQQPQRETAAAIRAIAEQHHVVYHQTELDVWANNVTRLSGDDVVFDEVEWLLVALQRSGHLSRPEALQLHVNYLRESRL